jgi:hypothetical protein
VFERLQDKLTGTDALIRAMHGSDREKFAEVFARSTVLFLQLPPGCENGLDPNLSQEELLAHIRAGAKDLSEREQFTPLRVLRGSRRVLLLFTQQAFVQEFAQDYVRQVKRIMPFEVLGVSGRIAVRLFDDVDAVVFNAATRHEYELPPGDISLLRNLFPQAKAAHAGQL